MRHGRDVHFDEEAVRQVVGDIDIQQRIDEVRRVGLLESALQQQGGVDCVVCEELRPTDRGFQFGAEDRDMTPVAILGCV